MEYEQAHSTKMSKAELCKIVAKKVGYLTNAAQEIIKKGKNEKLKFTRDYSNRCDVRLQEVNTKFDKQD